ncbi:MAG: hypothetical protein AABX55_02250 [Nanoarchaeota archaeon]
MTDIIKNLFKVVFGIVLIFLALWLSIGYNNQYGWWTATLTLIKGGLVLLVILVGLVLLLVGFSDMKNA